MGSGAEHDAVSAEGAGRCAYFARHPLIYAVALVGAGGTAVYAALRAAREDRRQRRLAYLALALNCAGQLGGMVICTERARVKPGSARRWPRKP